jgi:hypothetical protein
MLKTILVNYGTDCSIIKIQRYRWTSILMKIHSFGSLLWLWKPCIKYITADSYILGLVWLTIIIDRIVLQYWTLSYGMIHRQTLRYAISIYIISKVPILWNRVPGYKWHFIKGYQHNLSDYWPLNLLQICIQSLYRKWLKCPVPYLWRFIG